MGQCLDRLPLEPAEDEEVRRVFERWRDELHRLFAAHREVLPAEVAARGLEVRLGGGGVGPPPGGAGSVPLEHEGGRPRPRSRL